jgi:hypothetical protein
MIADDHIKRLQADLDGIDFDALRRAGIESLQALSSQSWTDYNLHDPGVTLLELLCYGLSDLVYRSDFDIPDFLAADGNFIDYAQQALFPPEAIFPSRPVTNTDYCKLIYEQIPEVDDVWIRPVYGKLSGADELSDKKTLANVIPNGLFSIFVKAHESLVGVPKKTEQELKKEITAVMAAQRNLCQDLYHVHIVKTQAYTLTGVIEIDETRPLADIYAEIYFRCAKLISAGARITRFEEALANGMSWEELLTGPLPEHGYIDSEHFNENNNVVDVVKLIALIRHIPGVTQVRNLGLIDTKQRSVNHISSDHHDDLFPVLQFPRDVAQMQALRLVYRRNPLGSNSNDSVSDQQKPVLPQDVTLWEHVSLSLKKFEFEYHAFRSNQGNLTRLLVLPQGEHRAFNDYLSIGEHTPAIYGINHYGVPNSEPPAVHARARQLKAYLYPFEQIMANYLASLQGIRQLYSVNENLQESYFVQFLQDAQIPNIETLYTEQANAQQIKQILHTHDNFSDRRNRVLDTLLAIYSECFPSEGMQRFNVYSQENGEHQAIQGKIKLLKALCFLSTNRGGALDLSKPYWDARNYAPLQLKIAILTGCNETNVGRSLVDHLNTGTPQFISDKRYKTSLEQQSQLPQAITYSSTIPLPHADNLTSLGRLRLPHNKLCPEMLKAGVQLSNYRLLPAPIKQFWLCLSCEDNASMWPLIRLSLSEAIDYAHQMRSQLLHLNQQCEGFHVLEHVLLRPRSKNVTRKINDDFYAHRVSIILPGFTPRFADLGCRAWIEELVSRNLPAHVLPEFYWLDFAFLAQFEHRYRAWLQHLRNASTANSMDTTMELDETSEQIIELLKLTRSRNQNTFWL